VIGQQIAALTKVRVSIQGSLDVRPHGGLGNPGSDQFKKALAGYDAIIHWLLLEVWGHFWGKNYTSSNNLSR
jgi:hypothetical protein